MEGSKRSERQFTVMQVDPETGEVDRNAVMGALGDIEAVGNRLGGAWICTPIRQEVTVAFNSQGAPITEHRTVGWAFEFVKYVPAIAAPTPTQTEAGQAATVEQAADDAEAQAQAARDLIEEREAVPDAIPAG